MNVLTLTGALGKECRTNTVNGKFVANFGVAMTSGYGNGKQTIWVECSYWGKGAEAVAKYLVKGTKVAVSGEVGHKDEGQYGWKITLNVSSLTLIGSKSDADVLPSQPASQSSVPSTANILDDDDIPF